MLFKTGDTYSVYALCFAVLTIPAVLTIVFLLIAKKKFPNPEQFEPKPEKIEKFRMTPSFIIYIIAISLFAFGFIDFSLINTFNLDEYVGLSSDHHQSYSFFMFKNLFHKIRLDSSRIHIPLGTAPDLLKECFQYEEAIQRLGGIDFQILGIGSNGHIGFNEPGTHFNSVTQVVSLSQETIKANSCFFNNLEEVPKKAITMGIKTIMNTRKILLLVSGANKAEIIHRALSGPVSEDVPASVLQLHPNTTVIIDQSIMR